MGRPLNKKYFDAVPGGTAIVAHARVLGSSTAKTADIVKQTSTNEYLMTTADGTSVCTIVATGSPAEGEAYILATDSLGSTYFVIKLTAHLATLMQYNDGGSGFVYPDEDEAPWSFDTASNITVQIENA